MVNGRSVLRYVGSYSIDQNYLLAITFATQTASSKLQIAKLEEVVAAGKELNCKRGRAVERGAMLIGFDADGTRVWLQMPRGMYFPGFSSKRRIFCCPRVRWQSFFRFASIFRNDIQGIFSPYPFTSK